MSSDRVAIAGSRGFADLFEGSNDYYLRYWEPPDDEIIQPLADWIVRIRAAVLEHARAAIAMVVPNKATCLPENYPLYLPRRQTATFAALRQMFTPYAGHCFFDWMTAGSFASRQRYWFKFDSHWNSHGAEAAARWVCQTVGVPFPLSIVDCRETYAGDLSGRWSTSPNLLEDVALRKLTVERQVVFDNADGAEHSGHAGRIVEWRAEAPLSDAHLLILGDSFSGAGYLPWNLTYWLAGCFARTTFVHAYASPADLARDLRADVVIFQTNERFVRAIPANYHPPGLPDGTVSSSAPDGGGR